MIWYVSNTEFNPLRCERSGRKFFGLKCWVETLTIMPATKSRYAFLCGFSHDWKEISTRRFKEVVALLVLMLSCRWLVHLSEGLQHGWEPSLTFSIMAVGFAAIAYTQLHLVAGLELAIDSFSINFFRDMDCGRALDEWNVLQATLRQTSTKLSVSMLILGICCGASMLFLVEIAFLADETRFIPQDLNNGFPLLLFTAWVFPPVLLFLYVLMRAAGVTEKASRVAPLVNSWNLEVDEDMVDDTYSHDWMDLGRQYIVQYIKQSETGFYMHGVKLHGFQVTKLGYYFGAFVFAIISKIGWVLSPLTNYLITFDKFKCTWGHVGRLCLTWISRPSEFIAIYLLVCDRRSAGVDFSRPLVWLAVVLIPAASDCLASKGRFSLFFVPLCSPFCGYALNMYSWRDWWSHFQAKVINAHLKHETWTWNGTSSILAENWQSLQLDVSGSILRVKNQCRVEKICKDEKNQCVSRFAKVFTHTLLLSSRPFSPCTKSFQRKVLIRNNMCSRATMLAGTNCYDHGRHPWEQTQKT